MTEEATRIVSDDENRDFETEISSRSRSQSQGQTTDNTVMSRTSSSSKKGKRSSKKTKQDEFESKLEGLEKNFEGLQQTFGQKFDLLFELMAKTSSNQPQDTGGLAMQRPEPFSENHSITGVRRPNVTTGTDNHSLGVRRQIIPLSPNLDEDLGSPRIARHRDQDEISFQPNSQERQDLLGMVDSDEDRDSVEISSPPHTKVDNDKTSKRSDRFAQYLQLKPDKEVSADSDKAKTSNNLLSQIFGDEICDSKESDKIGLIVDKAQENILDNSWRTKTPERLTAFKEEYRSCFPIHEQSQSLLQVPSLDELLEPMLRKTRGAKAVKNWDKYKQLHTQPLKQIERLAYQGQMAARFGIISVMYIQQSLATLLNSIESDGVSTQSIKLVRDLFEMSTKSLDQLGRTGAFHHLVRRKAAASDSGLGNLKDIQAKVLYLPLSPEGVFGKGLEEKLEKRKEQKEQLDDLLPEFSSNRNKRKSDFDNKENWKSKVPKLSYTENSKPSNNKQNFSKSYTSRPSQKPDVKTRDKENVNADKRDKSGKSWGTGGFRIPKKQNS